MCVCVCVCVRKMSNFKNTGKVITRTPRCYSTTPVSQPLFWIWRETTYLTPHRFSPIRCPMYHFCFGFSGSFQHTVGTPCLSEEYFFIPRMTDNLLNEDADTTNELQERIAPYAISAWLVCARSPPAYHNLTLSK